jgi:metal-responsive CopG/Arc/MetJ family transcriptional regulator
MKEKNKVTIKIPRTLYNKLKSQIKGTGFSSVNQFIVYCMRDIVATGNLKGNKEQLSDEEIKVLRERLRSLGYI